MKWMIAAAITGGLLIFAHFIVISSGLIRINFDFRMHKYVKHLRLLSLLWVACVPVFLFLYSSPLLDGICALCVKWQGLFNFLCGIVFFIIFLFYYLAFYYIADRSVSSRLMIEIENSPYKRMTFEEIRRIYAVDTKYRNELRGMLDGGFIVKQGDIYRNSLKGAVVGRIAGWYKRVFRMGKGG